jgi:peptide-methionine (R)-S-oxide reductase
MNKDLKKMPENYWKEKLTPEQYKVVRLKGTEIPFTGELLHNEETGIYKCVACGQELFKSDTKFDSGSGWPSFYDSIDKTKIELHEDTSHGMIRTEVTCSNCGAHLGHVFEDASQDTGVTYCINSASLGFDKKDE